MEVLNLCFHGVGRPARTLEDGEGAYWIEEPMFARVLDAAAGRTDVRLSFDDGNASDAEIGLPALRERGMRATFYALAGRLDQPGSLSREQVGELLAAGMRIGTHGMDHVPWRGLDAAARDRELVRAREILRELTSTPVDRAALPLGRYDRRLLGELHRLAYTQVDTSDRRRATEGRWLQPRYSLRAGDTMESFTRDVLTRPRPRERARGVAVGLLKRWR